jgi:hypothetical protein
LKENEAIGLWTVFINTVTGSKDGEAKRNALYVVGLYSLYGYTEAIRTAALSSLKSDTDLMSDDDIREYLLFLSGFGGEAEGLRSALIEQQFALLRAEFGAMSQRSLQRFGLCIEHPLIIKQADIETLIEDGLEVTAEASAEIWVEQARINLTTLTEAFPERLCNRTLALISTIDSPKRLLSLCGLFATSLAYAGSPGDADLLTRYFKNLTSEALTIRDASAKGLADVRKAKNSLLPFFRMKVEVALGEISQQQDTNLRCYRTTLDAILEFPDSITSRGYDSVFATAKKFLHMDEGEDKICGLGMVERSVEIHGPDISDIVYLAIHLGETNPSLRDRVKDLVNRLSDYTTDEAREHIRDFTQR